MSTTICVYLLGSEPKIRENLSKQLGKKGTCSDICLYNYDKEISLEVVDPIRYPDKPLSLFQTILMTDVPIILVPSSGPDLHTGEFGLLLDALGFNNGIVAIVHDSEYVNFEEIKDNFKKLFKDFPIGKFPILNIDLSKGESIIQFKEEIIKKYESRPKFIWSEQDHSRVDVDHVFPVKGVGTVILGRLRSGKLTKGENLHVFPSKRNCVLRSIQINDVDFNEAYENQRVGLALRGLLPKDVERGFLLSNSISWTITSEIDVKLKITPYSVLPKEGAIRHLIVGLQASPVKILSCASIKEKEEDLFLLRLKLEKEIVLFDKEPVILIDLNGKPKTIGRCYFN